MSTSDVARHALYTQLEDVLAQEHADTLMSYLAADRADEAATKSDIARLEARLDERMDGVDSRMDRFEQRMDRLGDTLVSQEQFYARSMVGAMVALTAIFSLVGRLLRLTSLSPGAPLR